MSAQCPRIDPLASTAPVSMAAAYDCLKSAIDRLNTARALAGNDPMGPGRAISIAITHAETAAMWVSQGRAQVQP